MRISGLTTHLVRLDPRAWYGDAETPREERTEWVHPISVFHTDEGIDGYVSGSGTNGEGRVQAHALHDVYFPGLAGGGSTRPARGLDDGDEHDPPCLSAVRCGGWPGRRRDLGPDRQGARHVRGHPDRRRAVEHADVPDRLALEPSSCGHVRRGAAGAGARPLRVQAHPGPRPSPRRELPARRAFDWDWIDDHTAEVLDTGSR
jgi:hypothetical protein